MRWQILVVLLLFLNRGYSQNQENEYKKMIDSAINIKSQELLKSYKSMPIDALGKESLYLIDENNLPYNYTGMPTGLEFKTMNISSEKNKYLLKKGIRAWKIITNLNGISLKIKIIDFLITYKNGIYNYSNGGGSETIFEYSCKENKWALVKSKYQGL